MKLIGLLTTATVLGLAGMASAECNWGKAEPTTASADFTPIPTADASEATQSPALLLPVDEVTDEG